MCFSIEVNVSLISVRGASKCAAAVGVHLVRGAAGVQAEKHGATILRGELITY